MKRRLSHGSTFSGIGAAEIAAEILGWDNKFHCEINDFGRKVLDFHFPRAESYGDIKQTSFKKWRGRIDVLTGGFPCQPFSTAGKRRGANDDRYLWGEMLRCIDEIRPTWFVGENVVGITTMVLPCEAVDVGGQTDLFGTSDHIQESRGRFVLEEICGNLESIGYSVQPLVVPACAVSAPHRRDRIFIVAHDALADTEGCADIRRAREIPCNEGAERLQERHDVLVFGESSEIRSQVQGTTQDPCCDRCDDNITEGESNERKLWDTSTGDDVRIRGEERIHLADTCCEGLERRGGTESSAEEGWREADGHLAGSIEECVRKFVIGRWEEFPTQPPLRGRNDGFSEDVVRYLNNEFFHEFQKRYSREDLSNLRKDFSKKEIRQSVGGFFKIQCEDLLQQVLFSEEELEQYRNEKHQFISQRSEEISERLLRKLRKQRPCSDSPQGLKLQEQFSRQFGFSLPSLSHGFALDVVEIEKEIQRVRSFVQKESLKAYGNAIVPQVMLEIFKAIEVIENGSNATELP